MATGLIALLDDVAALAKVAAASLDDTAAAAAKASAKAAGVVIDDAAVTPRYVHSFAASRELPIVWKIAKGSLRNKLLFLMPAALLLSQFAPWVITPLLMLGGAYLAFEGAEKLYEAIVPHAPHDAPGDPAAQDDPAAVEAATVSGAIRTDLILSAEIMAIALATVADEPFVTRALILALVAFGITALVYGAVAMIVKADDVGVVLARGGNGAVRAIGRALVTGMPPFLTFLSGLGIAAMLWVGGSIVVHGLGSFGWEAPEHLIHDASVAAGDAVPAAQGVAEWLVTAAGSGLFGVALGAVIVALLHLRPRKAQARA